MGGSVFRAICEWVHPCTCTMSDPLANGMANCLRVGYNISKETAQPKVDDEGFTEFIIILRGCLTLQNLYDDYDLPSSVLSTWIKTVLRSRSVYVKGSVGGLKGWGWCLHRVYLGRGHLFICKPLERIELPVRFWEREILYRVHIYWLHGCPAPTSVG